MTPEFEAVAEGILETGALQDRYAVDIRLWWCAACQVASRERVCWCCGDSDALERAREPVALTERSIPPRPNGYG